MTLPVTGPVLPWRDVLHDGPVPALAPAALRPVRAAFLASRGWATEAEALADMEQRDAALLGAEDVVLWFEHDLYDQLQLLQVLSLRDDAAAVITDDHLTALDLTRFEPVPVTSEEVRRARAAWDAFTAGGAVAVAEQAALPWDGALRHVGPALRRLLEELPWTTDGLGRSERSLLRAVGEGAGRSEAFARSQADEEARFLGDASAFAYLDDLAALADGERRAVLDGDADRVALIGIDRHLGGTRVRSPGAVWRWDPEGRVVAPE